MAAERQSITKVHAQDSRLTQVPYITQPLKQIRHLQAQTVEITLDCIEPLRYHILVYQQKSIF